MKKITMFFGKECPHCRAMLPKAEKIEKEENVKIEKLEVWHNEENAEKMRSLEKLIRKGCGGEFGVPAFINQEKNDAFCGEKPLEELKEWVKKNA